ncbi:hypothetical protein OIU78_013844 [Salix suchowensis]|nr:hypothetical protein OIU78_013844 [Salix suchowensis]
MVQDNMQHVKEDAFTLAKKIEDLEVSKRKLLGVGLEPCPIDELKQLENQLERSLTRIRSRKNQLLREQIQKLKGEEKILLEENTRLREKVVQCGMQPHELSSTKKKPQPLEDRRVMEVETELFIGPPETRLPPKTIKNSCIPAVSNLQYSSRFSSVNGFFLSKSFSSDKQVL